MDKIGRFFLRWLTFKFISSLSNDLHNLCLHNSYWTVEFSDRGCKPSLPGKITQKRYEWVLSNFESIRNSFSHELIIVHSFNFLIKTIKIKETTHCNTIEDFGTSDIQKIFEAIFPSWIFAFTQIKWFITNMADLSDIFFQEIVIKHLWHEFSF